MSPINDKVIVKMASVVAALILNVGAFSVYANEAEEGSDHRWGVGLFLGATHAHGENEPTVGAELYYLVNKDWSIGAVVEQTDRGEETTLLLAGLAWHPWHRLRLQLGAGRKDPSGEQENVVRTGFVYHWELAPSWELKPYFALDFIENEETEEVFGFYIGKSF